MVVDSAANTLIIVYHLLNSTVSIKVIKPNINVNTVTKTVHFFCDLISLLLQLIIKYTNSHTDKTCHVTFAILLVNTVSLPIGTPLIIILIPEDKSLNKTAIPNKIMNTITAIIQPLGIV